MPSCIPGFPPGSASKGCRFLQWVGGCARMAGPFGPLRYLYVGSSDVAADLAAWTKAGAQVVWDKAGFGTRVAAVRVGEGPLWLVAGHRPAPSVLPIFAVPDLKKAVK